MIMSSFFLTIALSISSSSGAYWPISRNRSAATSLIPSASLLCAISVSGDGGDEASFDLIFISFSIVVNFAEYKRLYEKHEQMEKKNRTSI